MHHEHGVSFNEISKLHALAYSWNGNASYLNTSLNAWRMLDKFEVQVCGKQTYLKKCFVVYKLR